MPPLNRSYGRRVHIWAMKAADERVYLGGLKRVQGITNRDFWQMLDVLLNASDDLVVQDGQGRAVGQDDQPLCKGDYLVFAETVEVTEEPALTRAYSVTTGTRVQSFRKAVIDRDRRCVVTKMGDAGDDEEDDTDEDRTSTKWVGFDAAHVFPLAYEKQWLEGDYGRHVDIVPPRGGSINSVQNGLLLNTSMHHLFDQYLFSINPDNGYKVIVFDHDMFGIVGQALDRRLLDHPRRPPDALLRWHFRQAVLTNMRGAGAPFYKHDFPPGSDIMGEIRDGPQAAARMEFELHDRLAHHVDILPPEV